MRSAAAGQRVLRYRMYTIVLATEIQQMNKCLIFRYSLVSEMAAAGTKKMEQLANKSPSRMRQHTRFVENQFHGSLNLFMLHLSGGRG